MIFNIVIYSWNQKKNARLLEVVLWNVMDIEDAWLDVLAKNSDCEALCSWTTWGYQGDFLQRFFELASADLLDQTELHFRKIETNY